MGKQRDKQHLFELIYEAKEAVVAEEKATAWDKVYAEIDRVRSATPYSRNQIVELLLRDGYFEYAKRRRIAERGA